jgi:hypothetical protein
VDGDSGDVFAVDTSFVGPGLAAMAVLYTRLARVATMKLVSLSDMDTSRRSASTLPREVIADFMKMVATVVRTKYILKRYDKGLGILSVEDEWGHPIARRLARDIVGNVDITLVIVGGSVNVVATVIFCVNHVVIRGVDDLAHGIPAIGVFPTKRSAQPASIVLRSSRNFYLSRLTHGNAVELRDGQTVRKVRPVL